MTSLTDLVEALHLLHREAGLPSTRRVALAVRIAGREQVSHETVAAMLRGDAAPRWPKLAAVVHQLAVWARADPDQQVRQFQDMWLAATGAEDVDTEVPSVLRAYSAGAMAENARLSFLLRRHMNAGDDPCQEDRGVDWPCDVAEAFMTDIGAEP